MWSFFFFFGKALPEEKKLIAAPGATLVPGLVLCCFCYLRAGATSVNIFEQHRIWVLAIYLVHRHEGGINLLIQLSVRKLNYSFNNTQTRKMSTPSLCSSLSNGRRRNTQPTESTEGILCATSRKRSTNKANLTMRCDANLWCC